MTIAQINTLIALIVAAVAARADYIATPADESNDNHNANCAHDHYMLHVEFVADELPEFHKHKAHSLVLRGVMACRRAKGLIDRDILLTNMLVQRVAAAC